ncbi:uncharacterized protein PHACADRAFT_207808 [Phanerochaete carnosa HHB-10118-sp]|uniref:Uncharacterized protein n=1 Tax=Phanerochaete carnosa (strain HHB-10118-sp) TaxID=650164 RepID=K5WBK8_PHACS|nr:uncharacterized protein PHACADRAFT_207808 [Phanerochaete carnosa HHB-10118-sp]EKM56605.1 hypothetical protein PHACADRAFT_207808 [Phanerochaete carnosa HHB-10118-sp]
MNSSSHPRPSPSEFDRKQGVGYQGTETIRSDADKRGRGPLKFSPENVAGVGTAASTKTAAAGADRPDDVECDGTSGLPGMTGAV